VAGHTESSIRIDAPRDFVFRVTNDLGQWPAMFTEYATVEIEEEGERHFVFRLTTKPDKEGKVYSWVSRRDLHPDEFRIEARRIEPLFPFASMDIRWWYDEDGDGTVMRWQQDFTVAPGAGFSEQDAEAYITASSHEQMTAIRAYVEEARRRSPG
jgi:aromatase